MSKDQLTMTSFEVDTQLSTSPLGSRMICCCSEYSIYDQWLEVREFLSGLALLSNVTEEYCSVSKVVAKPGTTVFQWFVSCRFSPDPPLPP